MYVLVDGRKQFLVPLKMSIVLSELDSFSRPVNRASIGRQIIFQFIIS